ncbi:hypothetical protein R3Q06_33435 [Rhodococcus erythropolis]|nr:hypothetical protein [Rhodococcus erythropolis]MDV6278343.1 hypothetical protein [Rhodococcus erythropolis]
MCTLCSADVPGGVGLLGFGNDASDLLARLLMPAVGVDRCVRGDLGAINCDRFEVPQTGLAGDHQYLSEQPSERVLALGTEPRDRAMVGDVLRAQHPEREIGRAQPFNLPRGTNPSAVGIDQK